MRNRATALMMGSALALLAQPALAQSSGEPSAESSGSTGLEDIVVTAQRRAENQQDVPISVTTLTAAAIVNAGVTSTDALRIVTPGLMFTTQQRSAQVFIRGVGSQSTGAGDEGAVATYVDGVYYPSSWGNIFSFNNIERIEVLKGPQGTLFGRNATGGLIHIITRDPSPDFGLQASADYGNYGTFEGSLYATGGNETIAGDVAIYGIHQARGWGEDLTNGGDVNRRREFALRSKVKWTMGDNDSLTGSFDFSRNNSDVGLIRVPIPGAKATGGFMNPGTIYDFIGNFRRFNDTEIKAIGGSLHYTHDFSGDVALSITSAIRRERSAYQFDSDGTPLTLVHSVLAERTRSIQNEILLNGTSGKLEWTVGAFFFNADTRFLLTQLTTIASLKTAGNRHQETNSISGFAQASYNITDRTRLTAGLRYTRDKRELDVVDVAYEGYMTPTAPPVPRPPGFVVFANEDSSSWGRLTWRLGVDHHLSDDVMVYASYNRGFKSGVYNLSSPNQPVVDPETIDAYEVGIKSELFDKVLRLNAAFFYYDYKDIQLQQVATAGAFLLNAASGRVKGADFEAEFAPRLGTGNLHIRAGLSLLDAEYSSFPDAPFSTPLPNGGNSSVKRDVTGNDMTRSPHTTITLSGDYSIPVGAGELGVTASYYHNSGFYFEPDNRRKQPAYDLVNATIFYAFGAEQQFRVRLWGRNLTKEKYFTSITEFAFGDQAVPGAPRTYGVGVDMKF